jgi:CheY-like chemotaxis protein
MKILLIEDDLDDIELLEEALKSHGISYQLKTINDGSAAVEYIRSAPEHPDIIILDLNLPKIHGRDVLLEIKSLAPVKHIPLLILTTSSSREDVEYAYEKGANKYLVKPTTTVQIRETVAAVVDLAKSAQKTG